MVLLGLLVFRSQYEYLYPTSEIVPRIYCKPKIHKASVPLRPKVDYMGSIGYNTSRAPADLLTLVVGQTKHHTKNLKDLAKELTQVTISENEVCNSHDVVSLFTNTTIQETLKIVREKLEQDLSYS